MTNYENYTVEIDASVLKELQYSYLLKQMMNYHEMLGQVFINKPIYWTPTTSDIPLDSVGFQIKKIEQIEDKWFATIKLYNTTMGNMLLDSLTKIAEAETTKNLIVQPTTANIGVLSWSNTPRVIFKPHAFKIGNVVKIYTINCFITNYRN